MDQSSQNAGRAVITGIGTVTSLGTGREDFWPSLLSGESGISPVTMFDTSRYKIQHGGEIHEFDPSRWCSRLDPGEMGRASQLAVAATQLMFRDAGVSADHVSAEKTGVYVGTTSGEPGVIEQFDDARMDKRKLPSRKLLAGYPCHVIAANVAREFQFTGDAMVVPAACAAGNYAIARAFDAIRSGRLDTVVAGGADSFSRITYTGFHRLGAIAKEKCQPFDANRTGMIPGEGAAMLMVERLDHALRRGARIYAEVLGYGLTCDAHHMVAPNGIGATKAIRVALAHASVAAESINYISAHGTGTRTNDLLESQAIRSVFPQDATPPISSIKSMLGHAMGAASAIEAAVCALAIHTSHVPPTANLSQPDPDCGELDFIPNEARSQTVDLALSNAFAFGGTNSSLILGRCVA